MTKNNWFTDSQNKAFQILKELNLLKTPIDVFEVASRLGISIVEQDLDDDVSGFLVRKDNKNIIGLNRNQHVVRQRFTVSHEIGHFSLHVEKPLFVDFFKGSKLYRSTTQPSDRQMEKEANAFAASLLMPKPLLKKELGKLSEDISYEKKLKTLSDLFRVSQQAMDYRLKSLGYYDYGF
ncbi:ImmA/IrrE family metallo-endopeptidase [Dokdonia sp. 4H-3-7-5]|uniref:ImmA/IrrE family metallo-endopeptidase n=1 Tax=Dokdonia sp. (strain 4H-3-7-5) TaxID=983548 RepID=UPI00020A648F|nr:ImmA/IrrE family metallo-endopeptidase [Dokdonia sp. 4H-3-7-5]AEE19464.1 protein of unknown function DUF955 [Dokdonia sp. 4H-3-7-5]